jgi:hypothetical protein
MSFSGLSGGVPDPYPLPRETVPALGDSGESGNVTWGGGTPPPVLHTLGGPKGENNVILHVEGVPTPTRLQGGGSRSQTNGAPPYGSRRLIVYRVLL